MTKRFVFLVMMLAGGLFSYAQHIGYPMNVVLQVRYFDPYEGLTGGQRGPVDPLTIGLEDHTLYMSNVDFDCELQILDENDNVVYSTFVVANTTTVVLPSTLSGDYQILLIDEDRYFSGWINM